MTNTLEDRVSTALKAVAATMPDEPPTTWADAAAPIQRQGRRQWWANRRRVTRWVRLAGVAGLVVVVAGPGVGVAAAAGAFTTAIGPAGGLITSSHSAPGEVTRVVTAGPAGSTLKVVSASSNSHSGCAALVITEPADASHPTTYEPGACDVIGNTAVPPSQTHLSIGYPTARDTWKSPTGTAFAIVYGPAPSGASSVSVVSGSGATVGTAVSRQVSTQHGWFAIAVPTSVVQSSSLVFYGSTGKVVTKQGPGGL